MLSDATHQTIRINRTDNTLLTLSLALTFAASASATEWTLEKDEERIRCFTRPATDSPFLEVKVTALIDASLEKVTQSLGNGDGCSEWRAMCKSSTVLGTATDTERYVYTVLDLPWPLSDRDMVVHSSVQVDTEAKTVNVNLESASSRHPEQDYVRAETKGGYQIKLTGDQRVEFTYTMHTDLGGNLSPDLINPRSCDSMYEDVKRLQVLAEG